MNQTKWLGHEIDENGIKPNEEKVGAILKLNPPENTKYLKSFLGAIHYMAKFLPKLSEKRIGSGNYCKETKRGIWEPNKMETSEK